MTDELRITSRPKPKKTPGVLQKAQSDHDARFAEIAAKRASQHAASAAEDIEAQQAKPAVRDEEAIRKSLIRENLEALEFDLPSETDPTQTMTIRLGPPKGVALTQVVLQMFGGMPFSVADDQFTRAMLFVQAVDGKPITRPATLVDRDALANQIGNLGVDGVIAMMNQHWPPLRRGELANIKKISRE